MDATNPAAHQNQPSDTVEALLKEVGERVAQASGSARGNPIVGTWYPWAGLCVVALAGEMDLNNAGELTRALEGPLRGGRRHLVVDLSGLTFVDSSGVHALVRAADATTSSGGAIVFTSPTSRVSRVLEILRFADAFTVTPTLEEALRGLPALPSPRRRRGSRPA